MEELTRSLSEENLNEEMLKQVGPPNICPMRQHPACRAGGIPQLAFALGFEYCYARFRPREKCACCQSVINDWMLAWVAMSGGRACLLFLV